MALVDIVVQFGRQCAVTPGKWSTIVLLHRGNGGKCCCFHLEIGKHLCCYTWEMENNFAVTPGEKDNVAVFT